GRCRTGREIHSALWIPPPMVNEPLICGGLRTVRCSCRVVARMSRLRDRDRADELVVARRRAVPEPGERRRLDEVADERARPGEGGEGAGSAIDAPCALAAPLRPGAFDDFQDDAPFGAA